MDLIIKNGTIVTDSETYEADIGIEDGRIALIGKDLAGADEVIDARGKYVMPAGLDVHVHLQLPFCGTVSSDDFVTGTKAAAAGGVTTIVDYAIQSKGNSVTEAVRARRGEADGKVCVDYSLHGGITDWNEQTRNELKKLIDDGIVSYKMFMIYRSEGWMATDSMLYQALLETKEHGGTIMVHAESVDVLDYLLDKYHNEEDMKKYGAYCHVLSRPNFIEEEAIQRAIKWAEESGGRLYVVHMSTGGGADLIKEAKKRGVNVFAETCPQYLLLEDDLFKGENGHLYGTCPQIKKKEDIDRLWHGLAVGDVDTLATDTCTFDTKQKAMWNGDFTKIPFGMPGSELMMPLVYTYGVREGKITLNQFVRYLCTNPAKIFGMYPAKGSLQVGTDADILIFDPDQKVTVDYRNMETNCDWSPYQGWELTGYPHITLLRGKVIAREGSFVGHVGGGKFIRRKKAIN
ncbi:MAG: dihydropyrimidinase [Candidatus Thermoplasmatota archaeon]|nr:dihydropyrimidinase [Candidatus Thermoplasmatota archaeon]MDP7265685.1 dihydropyrimidinase [Candidatus Thermoplasmatota archaeon]